MTSASAGMASGAEWRPSRGRVGMVGLIAAESSLFAVFVVAYLFYIGKSLNGPYPSEVLELPVLSTMCLLASSATVVLAVRALARGRPQVCGAWLAATIVLGAAFLAGTAAEWHHLIEGRGLTIRTNLFGTTFYALVGFHAAHVGLGLVMLAILCQLAFTGALRREHTERAELVSWYWHFVDAVWVVVFTVVYVVGR